MDIEVLMRFTVGFLIGACIWAVGNRARADTIPATATTNTQAGTPQTEWSPDGSAWFNNRQSAMDAGCQAARAPGSYCGDVSGAEWYDCTLTAGGWPTCSTYPNVSGMWGTVSKRTQGVTCPSGWTASGANCTQTVYSCPSGYTLSGTVCNSNPPAGGTDGPRLCIPATNSPGNGACYGGTLYNYRDASNQYAIGGVQQWCGPTQSSGQACTATTPQGASASPTSCPAGQVPGLINGQTVCLGAGETNPAVSVETQTQTTTNAQGQSTTTQTTTTTTDRGGAGATTTTTTTNPDGSSTSTTSNTNPTTKPTEMQRFCEQNPEVTICKRSTWAGACGAFACDGDAVQCAIAREMHQRNCALFDTQTTLSTLGTQVANGADPQASQNPALEANRQTTSLTGAISQETFLGQSGLADQQIVVSPRLTVTLPWSQLNQYLGYMGAIVVAFAMVFAARIVVGAR